MVRSWYLANIHFNTLEKDKSPITAPAIKTPIVNRFLSFTAPKTVSYDPISNKIKLPEIPGKIIAQIAIIPETKINHISSEFDNGGRIVIQKANPVPIIRLIIAPAFQLFTCFPTYKIDH